MFAFERPSADRQETLPAIKSTGNSMRLSMPEIQTSSLEECHRRAKAALQELSSAIKELERLPVDLGADALNDPVHRTRRALHAAFFHTSEIEFNADRGKP